MQYSFLYLKHSSLSHFIQQIVIPDIGKYIQLRINICNDQKRQDPYRRIYAELRHRSGVLHRSGKGLFIYSDHQDT